MLSVKHELTPQEVALRQAQIQFGPKAYTEDHLEFRLVGVPFYNKKKQKQEIRTGIGVTWPEAASRLEAELAYASGIYN